MRNILKIIRNMVKNINHIRNIETEGLKAPKFIECSTCQKLTMVGTFRHESVDGRIDDIYVVCTYQATLSGSRVRLHWAKLFLSSCFLCFSIALSEQPRRLARAI